MDPKDWRISLNLTLRKLSALMGGLTPGYISRVENKRKNPSGRILTLYHDLSDGRVTPGDFKKT